MCFYVSCDPLSPYTCLYRVSQDAYELGMGQGSDLVGKCPRRFQDPQITGYRKGRGENYPAHPLLSEIGLVCLHDDEFTMDFAVFEAMSPKSCSAGFQHHLLPIVFHTLHASHISVFPESILPLGLCIYHPHCLKCPSLSSASFLLNPQDPLKHRLLQEASPDFSV